MVLTSCVAFPALLPTSSDHADCQPHLGQYALAPRSSRGRSPLAGQGRGRRIQHAQVGGDEGATRCEGSESWYGADGMGSQEPRRLYPMI